MFALHLDLLTTDAEGAIPVRFVGPSDRINETTRGWAEANGFKGKPGQMLVAPDGHGGIAAVLVGAGETFDPMSARALPARLPPGLYRLEAEPEDSRKAALAFLLGTYVFDRYKARPDRDRVRLTVLSTVSTRDAASGSSIGGANVPGLNARTFSTTVEMREGQTLAVAGLIQTNLASAANRVPLLGDLPIIGRFFGSDNIQSGEQELVVLITPEIVRPLNQNELSTLPGSDVFEPGDIEFYMMGRLESRRSYDYRASVQTDIQRMLRYRRCEQLYLVGPTGHSSQLLSRPLSATIQGR